VDNVAEYGAGIYNVGLFVMFDGTLQDNYATWGGGLLADGGIFIMEDGHFIHNMATQFGAAAIVDNGQFVMHGGKIIDNVASVSCGGIFLTAVANNFAMSGGIITNNRTVNQSKQETGTLDFEAGTVRDPNERGLAFYGEKRPGARKGDPIINPAVRKVGEPDDWDVASYLAVYRKNSSGVYLPQPWGNNTTLEVRNGKLFVNNIEQVIQVFD
jgi:hypothetical protein